MKIKRFYPLGLIALIAIGLTLFGMAVYLSYWLARQIPTAELHGKALSIVEGLFEVIEKEGVARRYVVVSCRGPDTVIITIQHHVGPAAMDRIRELGRRLADREGVTAEISTEFP